MTILRDINDVMPRVPDMKWGALMNTPPTSRKVRYMDRIFPANGKWHTVFDEPDQVTIDGKRIWKKRPDSWT